MGMAWDNNSYVWVQQGATAQAQTGPLYISEWANGKGARMMMQFAYLLYILEGVNGESTWALTHFSCNGGQTMED